MRLAALAVAALAIAATTAPGVDRRVVITIDDLPVVSTRNDVAHWRQVTHDLLRTLTRYSVPAIGFVNEGKLYAADSTLDSARVQLLRDWVSAGLELGNHTYSHIDLHTTPLADYQADIERGEPVTRAVMADSGRTPRYFRHPFLHTGRRLGLRDSLNAFLAARGYTVAPVTIDNYDYVYARAFDRARDAGDRAGLRRVRRAYVPYMEGVTQFYEGQSRAIVGREIPQVLLLHANALNADQLDELLAMYRRRGYRFIALEEALRDTAFQSEDRWTGGAGISWIQRWGMTRGVPRETYRGEPEVAKDIERMSEASR